MSRRNQTVRPSDDIVDARTGLPVPEETNGDTPPKPKESKDAKFFRLAVKRVPAAIKRLRHVANLANTNQYAYTPEHAAKIIDALEAELRALKQAFSGTKAPVEAWTL